MECIGGNYKLVSIKLGDIVCVKETQVKSCKSACMWCKDSHSMRRGKSLGVTSVSRFQINGL
jgi:hypothetical protein